MEERTPRRAASLSTGRAAWCRATRSGEAQSQAHAAGGAMAPMEARRPAGSEEAARALSAERRRAPGRRPSGRQGAHAAPCAPRLPPCPGLLLLACAVRAVSTRPSAGPSRGEGWRGPVISLLGGGRRFSHPFPATMIFICSLGGPLLRNKICMCPGAGGATDNLPCPSPHPGAPGRKFGSRPGRAALCAGTLRSISLKPHHRLSSCCFSPSLCGQGKPETWKDQKNKTCPEKKAMEPSLPAPEPCHFARTAAADGRLENGRNCRSCNASVCRFLLGLVGLAPQCRWV